MQRPPIIDRELDHDRLEVPVVDGQRMSVLDDGPRQADETLLFLHGNPTWSFLWRHLLGPTIQDGHRVVAPDMIGLGMSEKPLAPAYHSLNRHVLNLEDAARRLELDDLTLVLHDWGGPIGMGLATRMPERVERIVAANTLAFPPSRKRSLSLWHKAFASRLGRVLGVRANLVAETAFRFGTREGVSSEVLEAYRWPLRDRGARIAAQRLVEMVPDGPDHPTSQTLRSIQEDFDRLDGIPMLVLWADRDPVMPPRLADKWSREFPQAEVRHASSTAGHFWQEDDPEPFVDAILDWVRQT